MADPETIRDAAFVAAMWDIETAEVRRLAEEDRLAALKGFVAATKIDENRVWSLMLCLDLYSVDELEEADAPDFAVGRRKLQVEPTEEQLAAQQAAQEQIAELEAKRQERRLEREREQAERERPPTLRDMLSRERTEDLDLNIAHNSRYFASQVSDLNEAEADDLRARLDDWWPDKPYGETITRKSENSWTQENFAAAWMWFGPALDKDLTPLQWAEMVCSGILFGDQTDWLRRKATPESKLELARRCTAEDTRVWHLALEATPDPLPDDLVEAIVGNLKTANEGTYDLDYIGQRLCDAAGTDPLLALSAVSDEFAAALRPILASQGDEEAQGSLLKELRAMLEAGQRPLDRSLGWLECSDE